MPVAYPFGYGLSYTTFAYSNLRLDKETMTDSDTLHVSFDITNTGSAAGKEIIKLYIRDLTGSTNRPLKELKGFEKVSLEPGETKTVTIELDYRSFAWYSTNLGDWYAAGGSYEIQVGSSSRDIRLLSKVTLKTARVLPLHVHKNTTLGSSAVTRVRKKLQRSLRIRSSQAWAPVLLKPLLKQFPMR